jgi:ABC-type oligopeptide transport system substrate-binding subunit
MHFRVEVFFLALAFTLLVSTAWSVNAMSTTVEAVAHFDNSAFNPYNPDAGKSVRYGAQTVDEMFNGFVFYVADDEQLNVNVDPKSGRAK